MMNSLSRRVHDILKKPYRRSIVPDSEGGFVGMIDEFTGCLTQGETFEETWAMLQEAAELWLESMIEAGQEIPAPYADRKESDFSGKLLTRLPKSLHRDLSNTAESEGVSLNTLIVSLLSAGVQARRSMVVTSGKTSSKK